MHWQIDRTAFSLYFLLVPSFAQSQCFYRDGSDADINNYKQCPGVDWCCKRTDTCASNGLCIDVNNHPNGSLTNLGGTNYNLTGLYQTASCIHSNWTGCETECSSSESSGAGYVWACNNELTEYCCLGDQGVGPQNACCQDNNQFELDTATLIAWDAVVTTSATTATPTSTPTTSTTPTSTPTTSADSGGLSQGAKIGIGVGVAAGALILLIIAFLLYRLRYLQSRLKKSTPPPPAGPRYSPAPQTGQVQESAGSGEVVAEYYSGTADGEHAGKTQQRPWELAGDSRRQEMP